MEIWKDIPWLEWKYQASNFGNIKSLNFNKTGEEWILKPTLIKWYANVWRICKVWKYTTSRVHRMIALTFIENPENKHQVNHKNWIRNDNRVENLEWCTASENVIHSFKVLWKVSRFSTNNPSKKWDRKRWWKIVLQLSKNRELIKKWDRYHHAKLELWINNIYHCLIWKKKSAWWFIWEYEE